MSAARAKIFLIVTTDVSAVAFYRGYLRFLADAGWDVTIVGESTGGLEKLAESEGVSSISIPMRRDPAPLHDLASLLLLWRTIRRGKPDVVITATPKGSLLGMLAARVAKVPVRIYQMWGLRLETEVGTRRRVFRTLEKITAASSTAIIANSRSLAEAARAEGISQAIEVLGSGSATGIDVARFSRDAECAPLDAATSAFIGDGTAFTVGFIGRLNRDKGLPTLLDAALKATNSGLPVRLLIVGGTESTEVEELVSVAARSLPIHRVGAVEDPRAYFKAMTVNCLPTLREGFPNVVLEAAALKVPTITTDATGARDSVVHNVTGLIFPVGDADELAAAIIRCARNPDLVERMSEAGRDRVLAEFESSKVWTHLEQFASAALAAVRKKGAR